IYFVAGLRLAEFSRCLAKSPLRNESNFGNYRLALLSDGTNVHLGLRAPAPLEGAVRVAFEKSLVALQRSGGPQPQVHVRAVGDFGAPSDPARFNVQTILAEARSAVGRDPEWQGFETFELTDPETRGAVAGFKSVHVMLAKETFFGLGASV